MSYWKRFILLVPVVFCTLGAARAATQPSVVTRDEAASVCAGWLATMVAHRGSWAGDATPTVRDVAPLDRRGLRVGWLCDVAPSGFVIVPVRRELSPIKVSCERGTADGSAVADLVLGDLYDRVSCLVQSGRDTGTAHRAWARYLGGASAAKAVFEEAGPLMSTRWSQGWPYNTSCPEGDGGRTFVGCTALATAQLMRHHAWPLRGEGGSAYWWAGDDGCGGATTGDTLRAEYGDPYDWEAMTDVVDAGSPTAGREAVAELCYEVAVACRMDFSVCGSSASLSRALSALMNRFRYASGAREQQRFRFDDDDWFRLIRDDVDAGRPLLYSSSIHTMVCDGWREIDGLRQVHINYGWGGASDGWFALDAIETSLNPAAERMICNLEPDFSTPVVLDSFVAERVGVGARLSWRVSDADGIAGLHVWREGAGESRLRLTESPLAVAAEMGWTDPAPPQGETGYWLEDLRVGSGSLWYGPARLAAAGPGPDFALSSPRPNPCNPRSVVELTLFRPQVVLATVHDLRGRTVSVLVDGPRPAGRISLGWDGATSSGRPVESGVYLFRVSAGGRSLVRKVILAR